MKKFYGIFIMLLMVQLSFAQKVSVPQLMSPENEFETAMPDVILDWSAVSGVGQITYQVQLSTDDAFSNLVIDTDGIEITAYYNMNLLFGQQYFWRVRAMDESSNPTSDWSEVFSFTVFSQIDLDKPKDGDDEVDLRPEFKWKSKVSGQDILGVGGFNIEVDTSENFDSPFHQMYTATGVVFTFIPDYLLFGTTHYWRARPIHSESNGEWSETRSFETLFGVELDKPSNNATDEEFDLTLEWDDLEANDDDIFEYTVEISVDENFTEPITLITTTPELNPTFLKFGQDYWWKVKVTTTTDVSIWSEVFKFSMVEAVTLSSPGDGEVINTTRPRLEWESLAEVEAYEVRYSENADLSDATTYMLPGADADNYPLPELAKDNDYYWTVRAYRDGDTTMWAETYHFNIPFNVGIDELVNVSELNIYPNPVSTDMTVSFMAKQSAEMTWTITDILGQNMMEEVVDVQTGTFQRNIDVSKLSQGIYFLEVKQGDQNSVIKFVIK